MEYFNFTMYKVIKVVLASLMGCVASSQGAAIPCSQPSNLSLQQLHSSLSDKGSALFPGIGSTSVSSDLEDRFTLYGDDTCPSTPASGENDPVEARSICPWRYVINHDPTRYPPSFAEARCKCTKCINNNINHCEEVKYSVPVLKQTDVCKDGYYVYEPDWLEISVGCTCAMPKTHVADPIEEEGPEI